MLMSWHRLLAGFSLAASQFSVDAYEWAGTFDTPASMYIWTAQSVSGKYVDPAMKLVLLATPGTDKYVLQGSEAMGAASIQGNCTVLPEGGTMTVAASSSTCYQLVFDTELHTSTYKINTSAASSLALFAEHVPTEFERDAHYLKDSTGEDIEPVAELPEPAALVKPWGAAIGAAIIVNLVTIIGILFLVPICSRLMHAYPTLLSVAINSFAAGALLAAALFLMLYEATHLIKPPGSGEAEQTGWWGAAVLLGFLAAYLVDAGVAFSSGGRDTHASPGQSATNASPDSTTATAHEAKLQAIEAVAMQEQITVKSLDAGDGVGADSRSQIRVITGVLLGDFMHNLVDGIFMGFAFLACGDGSGWVITVSTIAHEIAQEIADYLVLTDPHQGNLKPWQALVLNFLSGTSVILGVLIVMAQEIEDNFSMGLMLAFGGGIYIQIGAAECMPRAVEHAHSVCRRLLALFAFLVGATAIAAVLVAHEHCAPDGGHAH